jgi:protein CpxP
MKPVFKSLVVAGLLATAGFAVFSQGSGPMGEHRGMMGDGGMTMHDGKGSMGKMDSTKMEARMAKRHADLRAKLKITASQEGAWTAYTAAMKPPANMMNQHPDRAEMDKLTTPERIEKMKSLRNQHHTDMTTAMDKRDEATKTFYAALSAEQKKTFDSEHTQMGGRHGNDHGSKMGPKSGKAAPGAAVAPAAATAPKQ